MAGAFLEDRDNGRFFWSDDEPSDVPDSLRYSDDKDKIKDILHQIFWRDNSRSMQPSAKNLEINTEANEFRISDGPGGSSDHPTVIPDSDGEGLPPPSPSPRPAALPRFRNFPATPEGVSLDPAAHGVQSPPENEREGDEDPRQANGSLDSDAYIDKYNPNSWVAPYADMQPSTESPKVDNSTSARSKTSKRGRKRSATVEEALRSPERPSASEHSFAGAGSGSGTETLGTAPMSFPEEKDNLRITTESSANEGPADAAAGTANLQNDSEIGEQETAQSPGKATLSNPLRWLQPRSPAVPSSSRDAQQTTRTRESEGQATASEPYPLTKARVEYMYRAIYHYPEHRSDMTLADLEADLPLGLDASHTKLLRFVLKSPGTRADQIKANGNVLVQVEIDALTSIDSLKSKPNEADEGASGIEW
ncbi:hypothetical protein LX36DRAFT_680019 [Colletotrichum falcatum]|nr:hypothetical protein LX36DRAFT_680019 [Colletotrichum falcatum]